MIQDIPATANRFIETGRTVLITLNRQHVSQYCPECDESFSVVRGQVFDEERPFGLYLIALHGHAPDGRLAHMAIAILDPIESEPHPVAVALRVVAMPTETGFTLVDWAESPWKDEAYLGEMLDRTEALVSQHRALFFHIAEHVVDDLPEVQEYFG